MNSTKRQGLSGLIFKYHITYYFLEKETATYSSILACKLPRTEKPGRLQSIGSHDVTWHDMTEQLHFHFLWNAKRSNQSILKEINPEHSLERLMLKLKLQCFGHLMQRVNSLEKTESKWCWERLKEKGEGGWQWIRYAKSVWSCQTLCEPMDCSQPGSSLHGIL